MPDRILFPIDASHILILFGDVEILDHFAGIANGDAAVRDVLDNHASGPSPELSHDFTFVHNCSYYRDKYTKLSKLISNIRKIIAKYIGITGIIFAQMIISRPPPD